MSLYKKATEYNFYGYALKDQSIVELEKCLEDMSNGKKFVSNLLDSYLNSEESFAKNKIGKLNITEKKIIQLIVQYKTSKEIGELLFLSEKTIEGYRTQIIEKLDLPKKKNSLLVWAIQNQQSFS